MRRRDSDDAESGRAARLGALIVRHPREFVGLVMASIATGWIFTNALLLQRGPHPAPIFSAPVKHASAAAPVPPATVAPAGPAVTAPALPMPAPVRHVEPVRRNDPIAALLAPTPRMRAIQQALTEFGYGPVTPTGVYDPQTRGAITRFQEARGLPADGQMNERFLRELSKVAGKPLE